MMGDFPIADSNIILCDSGGITCYEYNMTEYTFEKIKNNNININSKDLNVNTTPSDLKKDLDKLENFCNNKLKLFTDEINSSLSLLTVKINKLEKELTNNLNGAGPNITNDINEQLKILGNILRYSTNISVDTINTMNFFIDGTIMLLKKILNNK